MAVPQSQAPCTAPEHYAWALAQPYSPDTGHSCAQSLTACRNTHHRQGHTGCPQPLCHGGHTDSLHGEPEVSTGVKPHAWPWLVLPRYLRWQPCGLAELRPKKAGLQRSQRGPATCSLQRHCPAINPRAGSSALSHRPPSREPSGSQSQAGDASRVSTLRAPGSA